MKLLYVGSGYVGACSAAVSAYSGHDILVYDIDKEKIKAFSSFENKKIEKALFEEGLADLFIRNKNRICFTYDIKELQDAIEDIDAIYMCLPTPENGESGETDMSYYKSALNDLSEVLKTRNNFNQEKYVLIINKSTVPLGTSEMSMEMLKKNGVENFGVASNPEFLVEGKAIEGSIRPERVVVGAWDEKGFKILRDIYKRFHDSPTTTYIEVNPNEAEAGKLLANYMLFSRLASCFDVMGRLSEKFDNLYFENLRKILISDERIGKWGFYDSLYAGGSCFTKDSRSLAYQLSEKGANINLIKDVLEANERQLNNFIKRPEGEIEDFDWKGKKVSLFGAAFKRDTNDIRNSGAIGIVNYLLEKNVSEIKIYDPVAGDNFVKYFNDNKINNIHKKSEAMSDSDVLIIATDWPEFRELHHGISKNLPKNSLIMDGRRMLQDKYNELVKNGYNIISVGSPFLKSK